MRGGGGGWRLQSPSHHSAECQTAQNLKIAAQFSTKLAQIFGTIFNEKFAMVGGG